MCVSSKSGTCFIQRNDLLAQENKIAGLIAGFPQQEQWGHKSREVDFYDLKGHIENILSLSRPVNEIIFKPEDSSRIASWTICCNLSCR